MIRHSSFAFVLLDRRGACSIAEAWLADRALAPEQFLKIPE
jgi:hypothetical protein